MRARSREQRLHGEQMGGDLMLPGCSRELQALVELGRRRRPLPGPDVAERKPGERLREQRDRSSLARSRGHAAMEREDRAVIAQEQPHGTGEAEPIGDSLGACIVASVGERERRPELWAIATIASPSRANAAPQLARLSRYSARSASAAATSPAAARRIRQESAGTPQVSSMSPDR